MADPDLMERAEVVMLLMHSAAIMSIRRRLVIRHAVEGLTLTNSDDTSRSVFVPSELLDARMKSSVEEVGRLIRLHLFAEVTRV